VAAAALLLHAAAADAAPKPRAVRALARPDVQVARIAAPRAAVVGVPFDVQVTLRERSRRAAAQASVTVSGGSAPVDVRVSAGGRARVVVPVTLDAPGTFALAVRARVSRDAAARNNAATTTIAATDFALAPSQVLVDSLAGYGVQFNQNVYTALSRSAGVADDNVGVMEDEVVALGPHLVRLFFNRAAFTDPDRMQSFMRTAQLARRTGATVNVTWQTTAGANVDAEVPLFADVLSDLVLNRGVNVAWASVQNEVNSTKLTFDQYDHMVRLLDARLRQNGVRDRVRIIGGDLVAAGQGDWIRFMAERESDVVDAYGVHVYWDFWSPEKIARRLAEVRQIVDALPAAARKPLYVTEFGARGHRVSGDGGPGAFDDGTPLGNTNLNAFQHAWLDVLAPQLGFAGVVKWDAYFGRYDSTPQAYTMIGPPQEGWPLRPTYYVTRLLTSTTRPGWKVVGVDRAAGSRMVSAYVGPQGELTLVGLDTAGATLTAPSGTVSTYTIGGLPPNTAFRLQLWNADGTGTLAAPVAATSDAAGVVRIGAPLQCVFALTTLPL
jgi:hypothetical protein